MSKQHLALQIIRVEQATSTSALALHELQQGHALPFAVLAAQQSAGKGQAGRVWLSPRGNLYLSLAVQPRLRNGLPLLVSALVCEWLQARGIAASCKWPNDILYNGKKLGGVLCEGAMQGEHWRYVIVGIGLNVNVVPPELQAQAISMREICECEGDVASYGEQLAHFCAAELDKPIQEEEALARNTRFTAAAAELWCRSKEFFLREKHPRGHLRLRSLLTGKVEELVSSLPDYRLAYQHPHHHPLLVADVGNSILKLVLFRDDKAELTLSALPKERSLAAALRKLRKALDDNGKWVIYATVVNHTHYALLQEQAERHAFAVVTLTNKPFRARTHYDFKQLGCDRLAAIEAYLAEYGDEDGVIVNFGTATTIDAIEGGYHSGGYILPGLETSLHALADYTELPRLPRRMFLQAQPVFGNRTDKAIAAGVLHSQVEYVRNLCGLLQTNTVVISGGLGQYAMPYLDTAAYDPLLVAKGIRALVLR